MNTIFRIDEIKNIRDNLYEVNLSSINENDEQIKNVVKYIKQITESDHGWYQLGKIMMNAGKYKEAEHIYKHIYDHTPERDREGHALLQHEFGYLNELKQNFSMSIDHYKNAIKIYLTYLPSTDPEHFVSLLLSQ